MQASRLISMSSAPLCVFKQSTENLNQQSEGGKLKMKKSIFVIISVVLCFIITHVTSAAEFITNGDFETGLTGWTVTNQAGGTGSFFADDANLQTPVSGSSTVGPSTGAVYAVSDSNGPGAHALTQSFTIPGPVTSVFLSFDMFVNDWSGLGPIVDPSGLDYTAVTNQHARVDILTAAAAPLSTAPADILWNFYLGVDPGPPVPYTSYFFDITGLVGAGGTFQLRFAEVDNIIYLNQGVDNISISTTAVPEPSTILLLGAGLAGVGLLRRRFKR